MPTWSGLYGAGLYFATDRAKSEGYCGESHVDNFIFIHDVIIEIPMTLEYGDWTSPSSRIHFSRSRDDDEHIIFNPDHQRIRYLVEFR